LEDNCAICLNQMEEAKKCPCGHFFHRNCIRRWMKVRRICPVCRAPLDNAQSGGRSPLVSRFFSLVRFIIGEVESNQGSAGQARAARPTVNHMVDTLQDMFPNLPRAVIQNELARVRNPDVAAERLLHIQARMVHPAPGMDHGHAQGHQHVHPHPQPHVHHHVQLHPGQHIPIIPGVHVQPIMNPFPGAQPAMASGFPGQPHQHAHRFNPFQAPVNLHQPFPLPNNRQPQGVLRRRFPQDEPSQPGS
jgi:hypothetical protein